MYFSSKSCAFWGLLLSWLLMCVGVPTDPPELRLGVGRADITGPAADVNFMVSGNNSHHIPVFPSFHVKPVCFSESPSGSVACVIRGPCLLKI